MQAKLQINQQLCIEKEDYVNVHETCHSYILHFSYKKSPKLFFEQTEIPFVQVALQQSRQVENKKKDGETFKQQYICINSNLSTLIEGGFQIYNPSEIY